MNAVYLDIPDVQKSAFLEVFGCKGTNCTLGRSRYILNLYNTYQVTAANKVLHEFPSKKVVVLVVTTLSVYVYNYIQIPDGSMDGRCFLHLQMIM